MDRFSPYMINVYNPLMAGSIDGTDTEPHDRGIQRAMCAKYKPNTRVKGDPALTLFVARLSPKTDEETLYNAFRQFGKIRQHRLVRDIVTGFSKCYGFVEFEDEKVLWRAYSEGKNMTIDDMEVLVDYEHERTLKNWVPRRLGGGFGGKKESGQLRFGARDRPFRKPILAAPLKRPGRVDHEIDAGHDQGVMGDEDDDRRWGSGQQSGDSRYRSRRSSDHHRFSDHHQTYHGRSERGQQHRTVDSHSRR